MHFTGQMALEEVYKNLGQGPLGINHTNFNLLNTVTEHSAFIYKI
jgi:hypothetical protein